MAMRRLWEWHQDYVEAHPHISSWIGFAECLKAAIVGGRLRHSPIQQVVAFYGVRLSKFKGYWARMLGSQRYEYFKICFCSFQSS